MKKIIIVFMVLILFIPNIVLSGDFNKKIEFCEKLSTISKSIMIYRQFGISKNETEQRISLLLNLLDFDNVGTRIYCLNVIDRTYKTVPVVKNSETGILIKSVGSIVYNNCIDEIVDETDF